MTNSLPIYHLVPVAYYEAQPQNKAYQPETFAQEGFIHCATGVEMLLEVANVYFATLAESLLVLEINPQHLTTSLKFEPPIHPTNQPFEDEADFVPESETLFPHIYGLLNREAIVNTFTLDRDELGLWYKPT